MLSMFAVSTYHLSVIVFEINYLEIDVKFIAKMCSISRSTYPAILK
jgi:hypothetical protein